MAQKIVMRFWDLYLPTQKDQAKNCARVSAHSAVIVNGRVHKSNWKLVTYHCLEKNIHAYILQTISWFTHVR